MRLAVGVLVLLAAGAAEAHGGGTDASGCHTDSSTGSYHCHGGGVVSSQAIFIIGALAVVSVISVAASAALFGVAWYLKGDDFWKDVFRSSDGAYSYRLQWEMWRSWLGHLRASS